MRWRDSASTPSLMVPGQVYEVTIDVWSTSYVVDPGHRVRISVTSSNAPRFSANPNTGKPLADTSTAPVVAKNVVHMGPQYPSRLILPRVALDQLRGSRV